MKKFEQFCNIVNEILEKELKTSLDYSELLTERLTSDAFESAWGKYEKVEEKKPTSEIFNDTLKTKFEDLKNLYDKNAETAFLSALFKFLFNSGFICPKALLESALEIINSVKEDKIKECIEDLIDTDNFSAIYRSLHLCEKYAISTSTFKSIVNTVVTNKCKKFLEEDKHLKGDAFTAADKWKIFLDIRTKRISNIKLELNEALIFVNSVQQKIFFIWELLQKPSALTDEIKTTKIKNYNFAYEGDEKQLSDTTQEESREVYQKIKEKQEIGDEDKDSNIIKYYEKEINLFFLMVLKVIAQAMENMDPKLPKSKKLIKIKKDCELYFLSYKEYNTATFMLNIYKLVLDPDMPASDTMFRMLIMLTRLLIDIEKFQQLVKSIMEIDTKSYLFISRFLIYCRIVQAYDFVIKIKKVIIDICEDFLNNNWDEKLNRLYEKVLTKKGIFLAIRGKIINKAIDISDLEFGFYENCFQADKNDGRNAFIVWEQFQSDSLYLKVNAEIEESIQTVELNAETYYSFAEDAEAILKNIKEEQKSGVHKTEIMEVVIWLGKRTPANFNKSSSVTTTSVDHLTGDGTKTKPKDMGDQAPIAKDTSSETKETEPTESATLENPPKDTSSETKEAETTESASLENLPIENPNVCEVELDDTGTKFLKSANRFLEKLGIIKFDSVIQKNLYVAIFNIVLLLTSEALKFYKSSLKSENLEKVKTIINTLKGIQLSNKNILPFDEEKILFEAIIELEKSFDQYNLKRILGIDKSETYRESAEFSFKLKTYHTYLQMLIQEDKTSKAEAENVLQFSKRSPVLNRAALFTPGLKPQEKKPLNSEIARQNYGIKLLNSAKEFLTDLTEISFADKTACALYRNKFATVINQCHQALIFFSASHTVELNEIINLCEQLEIKLKANKRNLFSVEQEFSNQTNAEYALNKLKSICEGLLNKTVVYRQR